MFLFFIFLLQSHLISRAFVWSLPHSLAYLSLHTRKRTAAHQQPFIRARRHVCVHLTVRRRRDRWSAVAAVTAHKSFRRHVLLQLWVHMCTCKYPSSTCPNHNTKYDIKPSLFSLSLSLSRTHARARFLSLSKARCDPANTVSTVAHVHIYTVFSSPPFHLPGFLYGEDRCDVWLRLEACISPQRFGLLPAATRWRTLALASCCCACVCFAAHS